MKFHKSSAGGRTMVYQYGTVPERVAPVENEEAALAQMKLARRLWNVLVAIDHARTARYRRIMQDPVQEEIDQLREALSALQKERKARSQKARAKVPTPDLDEEVSRVRIRMRFLVEHQQAAKEERHAARRTELNLLNERTRHRIVRARQAAASLGLFWGTYNAVLQSADTGRKLGELKFRGFRGEGTLTAQVMGGAEIGECLKSHTFFRVDPARGKWRYARIRIGSTAGRQPAWVAIPIVYHREIPPEARIKSVSVTRRILAGQVRWSLNVTVHLPPVIPRLSGQAIAVDLGWRLLPAGVRVGYWADESGRHGEIQIASSDIGELRERVRGLRSTVDKNLEAFRAQLVAFLATHTLDAEWTARSAHLAQWRSPDRVAALVRWWADHRLEDDDAAFAHAIAWRAQYLHLSNWWRNLQDQMVARVREQYRVFAAQVARQDYRMLILEDFDLRQVAEPAAEPAPGRKPSPYRQLVSPSVLRAALLNACRREGLEVRIVEAAYSTATCHACHATETWDQAANLIHRCGTCGALWDQDHNAALNLLASGLAAPTKNQPDRPEISPAAEDRSQTERKEAVGSIA